MGLKTRYLNALNITTKGKINPNTPVTFVSVHARRLDYLHYNTSYFHLSFFNRARDYFRVKYKTRKLLLFYIVSDDYNWARDKLWLNVTDLYIIPNSSTTEHDLALLSLADYSILSYGTFGLWGAFLANAQEILVSKKMMQTTKEGYELQQANLPNVIVI